MAGTDSTVRDPAREAVRFVTAGGRLAWGFVGHYLPTNLSLAEIGERLYVSRYTVKTHCASIYRKLNAASRSEAVESARRFGLLEAAAVDDTA